MIGSQTTRTAKLYHTLAVSEYGCNKSTQNISILACATSIDFLASTLHEKQNINDMLRSQRHKIT